jgi:hypothetical protein
MRTFLAAFADELIKVAAFPQQEQDVGPYDGSSSIGSVMEQTQGTGAKSGLKSGQPIAAAAAPKKLAPTPLTTPNNMVDVASKS